MTTAQAAFAALAAIFAVIGARLLESGETAAAVWLFVFALLGYVFIAAMILLSALAQNRAPRRPTSE